MATAAANTPNKKYIEIANKIMELMKDHPDHFVKDLNVLFEDTTYKKLKNSEIQKRRRDIISDSDYIFIFQDLAINNLNVDNVYNQLGSLQGKGYNKGIQSTDRGHEFFTANAVKIIDSNPKTPVTKWNFEIDNNYFHRKTMIMIAQLLIEKYFKDLLEVESTADDLCINGSCVRSTQGGKNKKTSKSKKTASKKKKADK
jgi:hypothetical protein